MRVERVVIDTNVLISAVLSPLGKPFACLHWVLDHATLTADDELTSPPTNVVELKGRNLSRPQSESREQQQDVIATTDGGRPIRRGKDTIDLLL